MENRNHVHVVKRFREFIVWSFIVVGALLVLASLLPLPPEAQTIVRSFGLSLVPAGVVTLVLSRYASSITEMLLREAVTTTIKDRLKQDMIALEGTVKNGLESIRDTVSQGTKKIEIDMEGLSPLFAASAKLGLENVLLTRGIALTEFAGFLDEEAAKAEKQEEARMWIVSSSLKGFLEACSANFDGRRTMERIGRCKACDLRIMMTDPGVADLRAKQERRDSGEIPQEVQMNLAYLKRIGAGRESVRFYPGTPTVFAIATSDRMLLNPYPYQTEAFRCFSVIVHRTLSPNGDIFHQYLRYHFEEPWNLATPLAVDFWDKL